MNKLKLAYSIIILLLLALSLPCQAGEKEVGTTAASFLKIGVGARAVGMGETFCGVSDDVTAIYWNPAGLGYLETNEISYTHNIWFGEITHGFLGYAHPIKDFTLGLGIDYLTAGEIEETTEAEPRGTGKMFRTEDDTAVFLSLSKRMEENLSLGMNIKYIKQEVADENTTGLGADLGLLYKFPRLNFGLAIQNFGTDMKLVKEEFRLPFNIKMGLAYKGIKNTTLAIDMNLPSDNRMRTNLGGEYWIGNILALRAGYNSSVSRNKLGKFNLGEGISAGFGVNLKMAQFDAAYIPYGDLEDTYRVSLLTRFGREDGEKKEKGREERAEPKEKATPEKKVIVKETVEPQVTHIQIKETAEGREALMPERKNDLLMAVTVFNQEGNRLLLYVRLKNISDHYIYVSPFHLALITEAIGSSQHIYSPRTYQVSDFLVGKGLKPYKEIGGFLVFETKDSPIRLIFDDKIGNFASTDL